MKQLSVIALSLASALSFTACVADEAELGGEAITEEQATQPQGDGKDLGEVSSQLTAWGITPATCSSGYCNIDLGTMDERTCFIGGFSGDLREGWAYISRVNNHFRLEMHPGEGKQVGATAICISGNTNMYVESWRTNLGAKPINGTVTSKRRCFISGILNTGSYNAFDNTSDYALVWKDSTGQWYLGGSVSGAADALVTTTCVDVTSPTAPWGIVGTGSFNLSYDPGSPNGVGCGLTKIGGNFINGLSDGLNIGFNFGTRYWNISADAGKSAEAICYK